MNKYGSVRTFSVGPAGRYQTLASEHKLYDKKGEEWERPRNLTSQRDF
jgi:hypothetical protein